MNHQYYIQRCIEIGTNGLGAAAPNPMVGCVIVYNNRIIGEGFTSSYGGAHAEVNAINSVKDKTLLKEATLFVTLEPCSHFGKTPPCSNLIIEHQIPNVVIGTIDTNSKVSGDGIKKLKASGCNVTLGILEDQCRMHHKRFFTFHDKKRPYIILKWAQTADGFIAPNEKTKREPVWITNDFSRQLVHKWRSEEQAILIGTKTVLEDNPSLTVRDWIGDNPIRVVIDNTKSLDQGFHVFNNKAETFSISISESNADENTAAYICNQLFKKNISSVIIEGGAKTLQTFLNANLWDEARVFTGPVRFDSGIEAPNISDCLVSEQHILDDILKIYLND